MKLKFTFFALVIITLISCSKDTTDYAGIAVCTGTTPTYTNSIATILNTNCALSGCYNNSAKKGIDLSNYNLASNQFKTNSNNLISIHHGSGVEAMPQGRAKMSDADINKLDCWVKNGCPQ
jgi:restriction endonuclease S subunit